MKLSPLQFKGCFFTDIAITAQPGAKNEDSNRIDVVVEEPDVVCPDPTQPSEWVVYLRVKLCPKEGITPPYLGEVKAFGAFSIDRGWPEKQREKLVYINGSGMVYSFVREMLCGITARGFYDMVVLPSWSFSDMYKDLEEARKLEAEKKQPSLPLAAQTTPASTQTTPIPTSSPAAK